MRIPTHSQSTLLVNFESGSLFLYTPHTRTHTSPPPPPQTPLMRAAIIGDATGVSTLLELGAAVNLANAGVGFVLRFAVDFGGGRPRVRESGTVQEGG